MAQTPQCLGKADENLGCHSIKVIAMNKRVLFTFRSGFLSFGLLLAAGWAYWNQQSPGDAWVVEPAEQVVSGVTVGQKLHVTFILRNTDSQPRRILGVEAC
jgi:hypothetical protein